MQLQFSSDGPARKRYPSDVSDEEWGFVAPYLTLIREDAAQRVHDLREVFNALRYLVRVGESWRYLPNDLPPWPAVYQQTQRWIKAGVFEAMAHDLRAVLRLADVDAKGGAGREPRPTAIVLDGTILRSTPESGRRAGYNGHERKKGGKRHLSVDTLGHLLALRVTPANVDERAEVAALATGRQAATGGTVELAYVGQGYTGSDVAADAAAHGIILEVVKLSEAKRGFVLLPRRWVVERSIRSISRMRRLRRLAKDYERLPETVAGLHFLAFAWLLLSRAVKLFALSA
jgi:transposase